MRQRKLRVRIATRSGHEVVRFEPIFITGKYFCVTPSAGLEGDVGPDYSAFAVTHIPTGLALIARVCDLGKARLISQQIERIPLGWNSREMAVILKRFSKLSPCDKEKVLTLERGEPLPVDRAKKAARRG